MSRSLLLTVTILSGLAFGKSFNQTVDNSGSESRDGIYMQVYSDDKTLATDMQLKELFIRGNSVYKIQNDYDLKGNSVSIPKNATLVFDGGSISNGKLIGSYTIIDAPSVKVFDNVTFEGSWSGTFNAAWLGLRTDDRTFDNGVVINSLPFARFNEVYIPAFRLYFSTPIVVHNTEHFVCDADLYFVGKGKSVSIIKLYTLLDAKVDFNGTIWNHSSSLSLVKPISSIVGIDLVDSYDVTLYVKKFIGANECLRLMSTGTTETKGCAYNTIHLGLLASCNTGIRLNSQKGGWVNQNNIYGGRIVCQYGKVVPDNMRRIVVDTDSKVNDALTVVGLSMEGSGIGVEATHLYGSAFVNCRFEGLDYAFVGHGTCRWNEIKDASGTAMPKVNLDDCGLCAIDGRSLSPYMNIVLNDGESLTLNKKNGSGNNQLFYRIVELEDNTHCQLRYTKFTDGRTVPESFMLRENNTPVFFTHNRGRAYFNTYAVHFTTEFTSFPTDIQELTLKAAGGKVSVQVFTLN